MTILATVSAAELHAELRERRYHGGVEVRTPRAGTMPVTWVNPGRGMVPRWDAAQAIDLAYLESSIVFACVDVLSRAVAKCPVRAVRNLREPTSYNEQAPIARLLGPPPDGPNPLWASRRFWRYMVAMRVVTGRMGWEIETQDGTPDGVPVGLWPLASTLLTPVPTEGGDDYWAGYWYGRTVNRKWLEPGRVFYDWRPSLTDPRDAESVLQGARLDVSLDVLAARYNVAFLRNDGRPAGVVVHDPFEEDEDRLAFEQQFQARHGGPDNANRVAFATRGDPGDPTDKSPSIEWVQTGIAQRDAQLLEIWHNSADRICMATGVPKSMLDASGRTFDNASEEVRNFWGNTVVDLQDEIADEVNLKLSPRVGAEMVYFDVSKIPALQPMRKFTAISMGEAIDRDVATREEVRVDAGLPADMEDDDSADDADAGRSLLEQAQAFLALTQGGVPVDQAAAACGLDGITAPEPAAGSSVTSPTQPEPTPAAQPAANAPIMPRPPASHLVVVQGGRSADVVAEVRHAVSVARRRQRIYRTTEAHVGGLEGVWERGARSLFARQADATLRRLDGRRGHAAVAEMRAAVEARDDASTAPDASAIFDDAFWTAETASAAEGWYDAVFAQSGARMADAFGLSFDLEAPFVRDWIATAAQQLGGDITSTTLDEIRAALAEGVSNGEGIDGISARVRQVFQRAGAQRARTIARTEVLGAYNGASLEVADNLGPDIIAAKEWIAKIDGRTRPAHAAADGQTVPLSGTFMVGGATMRGPGDRSAPAEMVVNCRCSVGFMDASEVTRRGALLREVPFEAAREYLAAVAAGEVRSA